jgi:hypothetical protein
VILLLWALHAGGVTAGRLDVDGPRVRLELSVSDEDRGSLDLKAYLAKRLTLEVDGLLLSPTIDGTRMEWRAPRDVRHLRLSGALFLEHDPDHRTLIDLPGGRAVVLDRRTPDVDWTSPPRSAWLVLTGLLAAAAIAGRRGLRRALPAL